MRQPYKKVHSIGRTQRKYFHDSISGFEVLNPAYGKMVTNPAWEKAKFCLAVVPIGFKHKGVRVLKSQRCDCLNHAKHITRFVFTPNVRSQL